MDIADVDSIRYHFLMKRYGMRWLHNTYGKARVATADSHFRQQLQRVVFTAWEDYVWCSKDWALVIRADCHYKFRIWSKTLVSWQRFVIISKYKKELETKAKQIKFTIYCKKSLSSWKQFVFFQKNRRSNFCKALRINHKRLVQSCFQTWRSELLKVTSRKKLMLTALSFWSATLTRSCWQIWCVQYDESKLRNVYLLEADRYNNINIMCKALCKMKGYSEYRKDKKAIKYKLNHFFHSKLIKKYYALWRRRLIKEINIKQKQRLIEELAQSSKVRRVIVHWKDYINIKRWEKTEILVSNNFHDTLLKRQSFLEFKRAYRIRLQLKLNTQIALKKWVVWRYKYAWNNWQDKLEVVRDEAMKPQFKRADDYYFSALVIKSFKALKSYSQVQADKKARYRIVETYYQTHLLRKSLSSLKQFVSFEKERIRSERVADNFFRTSLLNRAFYTWVDNYEEKLYIISQSQQADCIYRNKLMQSCWNKWKLSLSIIEQNLLRLHKADVHKRISFHKSIFNNWRQFAQIKSEQSRKKEFANKYFEVKIFRKWYMRMKQIYDRHCLIRIKCQSLMKCLNSVKLGKYFHAWLQFIHISQYEKCLEQKATHYFNIKLIRIVFIHWLDHVKFLKSLKKNNEIATRFRLNNFLSTSFIRWQIAYRVIVEDTYIEIERAEVYKSLLSKGVLSRCFSAWLSLKDKTVIKRYFILKSDNFRHNLLIKSSFSQWKHQYELHHKNVNLLKVSEMFSNTRILTRSYTQWRLQMNSQIEINHKRIVALWFWSMNIQKHSFSALNCYRLERKRKKTRYAEAALQYRERILKKGICHILTSGDAILRSEEQVVLKQIEENTKYKWYCALKWGRVWREKTRRARQNENIWLENRQILTSIPYEGLLHFEYEEDYNKANTITQRAKIPPRIPDFLKTHDDASISYPATHNSALPMKLCESDQHLTRNSDPPIGDLGIACTNYTSLGEALIKNHNDRILNTDEYKDEPDVNDLLNATYDLHTNPYSMGNLQQEIVHHRTQHKTINITNNIPMETNNNNNNNNNNTVVLSYRDLELLHRVKINLETAYKYKMQLSELKYKSAHDTHTTSECDEYTQEIDNRIIILQTTIQSLEKSIQEDIQLVRNNVYIT